MKVFIFLYSVLFLVGCSYDAPDSLPYPGKLGVLDCRNSWYLGYMHDHPKLVDKCEQHMSNPKYKIGQKVNLPESFDKSCIGTIVGLRWGITQGLYVLNIMCNGKTDLGNEILPESDLQSK